MLKELLSEYGAAKVFEYKPIFLAEKRKADGGVKENFEHFKSISKKYGKG